MSSEENIELHRMLKISQEHGRFNRAITTVADAALDSDGCLSFLINRIFVDTSVLLRCYFAFVLPILEYCSPVWGSAVECHLQLLELQALFR